MISWSRGFNRERKFLFLSVEKSSEIIISPEPLHLWSGIPVNDIAFFILKVPWYDNRDVPFANPDLFLNLSHAGDAIETPDPDVVCTHHQFSTTKHLPVSFLGEFYPYDFPGGFRSFFTIEGFFFCQ
jgi:hypothetical protein